MNYKKGTQTRGCMKSVMRYVSQPGKTFWDGQNLVSGIGCQPETAFDEFLSTKLLHHKEGGMMFYHMVQSFPKGADVDPRTAHEAARRLAGYFDGCEVLVCTHVDREHIHSHCIINSVNFETGRKVHMADEQIQELRVRNDEICEELGLPKFQRDEQRKTQGMSNAEYYTASKGESWKFELMRVIDECMRCAGSREEFLILLRSEGYDATWTDSRKNITYITPSGLKCRDSKLHMAKYLKENMEAEFGFMNGSNYYDELTPDVTSYDYDALLTEDGQITEKYRRYRDVIAKYREIPEVTFTTEIKRKAYGTLPVKEKVSLFSVLDDLSAPVESSFPQSMEKLGQNYGYILYHSTLDTEEKLEKLRLWEANDRANIFVDQKPVTTLYDLELLKEKELDVTFERGADFDILMENMGRVNFGPRMEHQRKGIGQCVQVNGHMHNHWKQYTLPLDNIEKVDFSKEYKEGLPGFYRFTVDIDETADTFLDFEGWGKGCVFVNGFNIGRFWEIGPQKRLYIPAPLLKKGENEIIVFETEGKTRDTIVLKDEPDIG